MSMKQTIASAIAVIIVLVGAMAIFGSFYSVDGGERAAVLRFGDVTKVTGPGLHWKTPFVESVKKFSIRLQCTTWDNSMEAYSFDQQPAIIGMKVCYQARVTDDAIKDLYEEYKTIKRYSERVVQPSTMKTTKDVFGTYTAVNAIRTRKEFGDVVERLLREIEGPVEIKTVDIQNIAFSEAYEHSVEERMKAEVEVERFAQNKEREQLQADIKVIQAQAEAERVRLAGEAEASAIDARGKALRDNPQLVELVAAEKWDGKLPITQVPGSAVPFLNIPTSTQ